MYQGTKHSNNITAGSSTSITFQGSPPSVSEAASFAIDTALQKERDTE